MQLASFPIPEKLKLDTPLQFKLINSKVQDSTSDLLSKAAYQKPNN